MAKDAKGHGSETAGTAYNRKAGNLWIGPPPAVARQTTRERFADALHGTHNDRYVAGRMRAAGLSRAAKIGAIAYAAQAAAGTAAGIGWALWHAYGG